MAAGDSGLGGSSPSGYRESFPESVAGVCCPLASGLPAGVGRSPAPARVLPPQCFLIPHPEGLHRGLVGRPRGGHAWHPPSH